MLTLIGVLSIFVGVEGGLFCDLVNEMCTTIMPRAGIATFFGCQGIVAAATAACQAAIVPGIKDGCSVATAVALEGSCLASWWTGAAFTFATCANAMRCNADAATEEVVVPAPPPGACMCLTRIVHDHRDGGVGFPEQYCASVPPNSRACLTQNILEGAQCEYHEFTNAGPRPLCDDRSVEVHEVRRRDQVGDFGGDYFTRDVIYKLNPGRADEEVSRRLESCEEHCSECEDVSCQFERLVKGLIPDGACRSCLAENHGVFESRRHQDYASETKEEHCAMLDCAQEFKECVHEYGPVNADDAAIDARIDIYKCVREKENERCQACLDSIYDHNVQKQECDGSSGPCWCVDGMNQEIEGSRLSAKQRQRWMDTKGHIPDCDFIVAHRIESEKWLPEGGLWQGDYLAVYKNVLWHEARDNCRSWGMELAAPCNDGEAKAIRELHPNWPLWIGLENIESKVVIGSGMVTSSTWSNGETCTYRNWYGRPNLNGGDGAFCGYMSGFCRSGKYCAIACDEFKMFYACQRPKL